MLRIEKNFFYLLQHDVDFISARNLKENEMQTIDIYLQNKIVN